MKQFLKKIWYFFYNPQIINIFFITFISGLFLGEIFVFKKEFLKEKQTFKQELTYSKNIKRVEKRFFEDLEKEFFFFVLFLYGILLTNFFVVSGLNKSRNYDELTGLMKKKYFVKKAEFIKLLKQNLAIVFIDLDNFKEINDTAGHEVGDLVLIQVAKKIKDVLQTDFVARIGGDEFIAVIPFENKEKLKQILEELKNELFMRRKFGNISYQVSASIGVAIYPEHSYDIKELIKKADISMYNVKKNGKSAVSFYNFRIENKTKNKIKIKSGLEKILLNGEFTEDYTLEVFLQPQMDRLKRVKGAEALIRWRYSKKPLYLMPKDFLDIALSSGLIYHIDLFVMETIAQKIRSWLDMGIYNIPTISTNLTMTNLEKEDFIDKLLKILEKYNVPVELIGLEITEESVMKNPEKNIALLNSLRKKGFIISIDDFGTGYSNLEYLKRFNVNKIKIDKMFVQNLPNYKDEVILKAVNVLANGFGLETIAEGVENEKQLKAVWNAGIDLIQGYYFSKPIPINEFERKYLSLKK